MQVNSLVMFEQKTCTYFRLIAVFCEVKFPETGFLVFTNQNDDNGIELINPWGNKQERPWYSLHCLVGESLDK